MAQLHPKQPTIPGIDQRQLHERLGNDAPLIQQVLARFAETQRGAAADLDALAVTDRAAARARAHELKGMLGNIAATSLFETARALESALEQNDTRSAGPLIAALREDLPRLCDAILATVPAPAAVPMQPAPALEPAALAERLGQLRGYLRSGRAREARRLTEELRSANLDVEQQALIERVTTLVSGYRLRDALAILEAGDHD